tara:strand:- start:35717 stop:35899 length:183 start_codon:yes stop_codon:yes gene_type:complete
MISQPASFVAYIECCQLSHGHTAGQSLRAQCYARNKIGASSFAGMNVLPMTTTFALHLEQ